MGRKIEILTGAKDQISKVEMASIVYLCYGYKQKQVWLSTETNITMLYNSLLTNENDDMRERHTKDAQSLYWNKGIHLRVYAIMKSRIISFLTLGFCKENYLGILRFTGQ